MMKNDKLKKQLMAIGVQRNDAEAFIRSYRKIQKAGMHKLCEAIMNPPIPVHVQKINLNPKRLRAEVIIERDKLYTSMNPAELVEITTRKVIDQLAEHLVESGAVDMRTNYELSGLLVRGDVLVIMPGDHPY